MRIYGLTAPEVANTLKGIGLELVNGKVVGKAVQGRIAPASSFGIYARTTPRGRHLKACCYHGFRDGIMALFATGAVRIVSTAGDYRSVESFRSALADLYDAPMGSLFEPCTMSELCECETSGDNYLTGPVVGATVNAA